MAAYLATVQCRRADDEQPRAGGSTQARPTDLATGALCAVAKAPRQAASSPPDL